MRKRTLAFVLAALAAGCVTKVIREPAPAPGPAPAGGGQTVAAVPAVQNVEGTIWSGNDSDGDFYRYYFNRGGQLSWDSPSGNGNTTGTWRQNGTEIYMETNGRYAEWQGVISGNTMSGKAWNQAGHKWDWQATLEGSGGGGGGGGGQVIGGGGGGGSAPSVEGTIWSGNDSDGDFYRYYFNRGGQLSWDSPSGNGNTTGTWRQNGNQIYMETNGRYAEWQGTISGNTMSGNAWNQAGHKWSWQATQEQGGGGGGGGGGFGGGGGGGGGGSVEGTVWSGTDSDGDFYRYYFNRGGQLTWDSPSGNGNTTGTWSQNGDQIYMETNGRYAEWQGKISGNTMSGKAWNQAGHRWDWNATRER